MGQFLPIIKSNCPPCEAANNKPQPRASNEKSFGRARIAPDGSISYPKKGFEPPPPVEGYERDKGNPWHFKPLWPDCKHRARTLQMKKCGAYDVIMVCGCNGCPLKQQLLKLPDCQNCPHRQAP